MTQTVLSLVFDDVQMLDAVGPIEVFSTANKLADSNLYRLMVASPSGNAVRTSSGVVLEVESAWHEEPARHTVLLSGGDGVRPLLNDDSALRELKRLCAESQRVASICTGAFLLGSLGLLDGRRSATHWAREEEFARRYPNTLVERNCLHVEDGVWTSAGVCAGMDLALALVEEDHGSQLAHDVARWLVLFMRREGDGPQHGPTLRSKAVEQRAVARVRGYILSHPEDDLRVHVLARRAAMSPRNFTRTFVRETGTTPAEFVRQTRTTRARQLLGSGMSMAEAAERSGLRSRQNLRRALEALPCSDR